ncbi:MAG TPA: sorbosone dehydrogenase family protein [Oleiagrimonas sp.]|nr:sorbosone dehydrogenase family protein [Oleiagrimonas sp.]
MRVVLLCVLALLSSSACAASLPLSELTLPPGFHISVYASEVPAAREMTIGDDGTVFVGSSGAGKVYALTDSDHDGHADKVRVVASGLDTPIGVAFHDDDLYVSAIDRIVVLRDIENHLDNPPAPQVVTDKLPTKHHHGGRFIAFGPDGRLYVPVGAPCNICEPPPPFASLLSMKPDGSDWQTVATGIRNTVGFDWQPGSGKLWFTDNGRDMLGDNRPSDELNRIDHAGENFGYPYCHAGDIADPEYGKGHPCSDYAPPALKLGAHVASLGMRFYTGSMFPDSYQGAIFIAEHGSWNRSSKVGYRVMVVRVDGDEVVSYKPFVTGFLQGQQAWGRPVDVQPMPDGSLLISDDGAGAVYRVTYESEGAGG